MPGNFASFDLVIAVIKRFPEPIEELTVATLGFNKRNFSHLSDLIDEGAIKSAYILASEYFAATDRGAAGLALAKSRNRPLKIGFGRNHAKIQVLFGNTVQIVSETSANLRSCNNIEQATIFNNRELADFHRSWIKEVINHQTK
jgi:hypothetical protein